MKQPIFIVCGYGVPENVRSHENYRTYLNVVFNTVFDLARSAYAAIIVCGGPTNGKPPYNKTEAVAMAEYLEELKRRTEMNGQADLWTIHQEDASLSSLENLVFAGRLIELKSLKGPITIFCEKTRERRLRQIGQAVLGDVDVISIDFDVSKNRYLDSATVEKKEQAALEEALWTLEDKSRLETHHQFFEKKIEWFREREESGMSHVDAVEQWYKTKLLELTKEIMPDNPLLTN